MKQLLLLGLALTGWPLRGAAQVLTNSGATLTVQAGTTLTVSGSVQNQAGATLTNGGTVQLSGDLNNAGTLASAGTLLFSGAADQTFAPGTATVATLVVNNTGAAGSNRLFVADNLTIGTLLNLQSGLVRTQGAAAGSPLYTLSLPDGASVQGEATGRYVQGRLAVARTSVGPGLTDFTNGFSISLPSQSLGAVTVTRTAGLQAAGLSYGQNLSGTNRGIDRVWEVVAAQPLSAAQPATIAVSWVTDDDNGLNPSAPVQLWRADQATGPWAAQGAPGTASARSFAASATQLGTFTVSNASAPLPVELIAFTAERLGADGLLKWATASELRNDHFEVESSVDGHSFQPLGRIAGVGTSSQTHSYQFVDPNLVRYAAPLVYYRLRQVDLDGTATFSPVRTVAVPLEAGLLVQAYPNPSAPGAAVALSIRTGQAGPATLRLTDMLGRELGQQQADLPAGATTLPLPGAGQLATGVYLLRVQQGGQQQALKLVRQ
jgi:hypothetical protein